MGGKADRKGDWQLRRQGGADGMLQDFQRSMNNLEAFGTMTQLALNLQPTLAQMQTRKPEQGQLSIQDRTSMLANAYSPQAGTPPHPITLDLSNDPTPQPAILKLRSDLDGLAKQVDQQADKIAQQSAKIDSIAETTAASAKESRETAVSAAHTNLMVQEILTKMERDRNPDKMLRTFTRSKKASEGSTGIRSRYSEGTLTTESEEPGSDVATFKTGSPTPLLSKMVDKEQHNSVCELTNLRANKQAQELCASLGPAGLPYQDWWPRIADLCTTAHWHRKLQALGMPAEQVELADKDLEGQYLFQHFDSDGIYHKIPLQRSPQENLRRKRQKKRLAAFNGLNVFPYLGPDRVRVLCWIFFSAFFLLIGLTLFVAQCLPSLMYGQGGTVHTDTQQNTLCTNCDGY